MFFKVGPESAFKLSFLEESTLPDLIFQCGLTDSYCKEHFYALDQLKEGGYVDICLVEKNKVEIQMRASNESEFVLATACNDIKSCLKVNLSIIISDKIHPI